MRNFNYADLYFPTQRANQLTTKTASLRGFQSKIDLELEKGDYTVRTARSQEELIPALQLRHDVFFEEILNKCHVDGIDIDEFDFDCDHLLVIDNKTTQVVGTYRLNCSLFSRSFYSAKEFTLDHLLILPGIKLELGRACIHKDFRNGSVLSLLWRGITEYIMKSKATYVIGCTSVFIENPSVVAQIMHYFYSTGAVESRHFIQPTTKFKMPSLTAEFLKLSKAARLGDLDFTEAESVVPSLLQRYLKFGAKVCPTPAWDEEFNCVDFLTILETSKLNR